MNRSTVVIEGPLAWAEARYEAARRSSHGLQIMDVPTLATRLAGGLLHMAAPEEIERAIAIALQAGEYVELDSVKERPGMIRAVAVTLGKLWRSGIELERQAIRNARVDDIIELERRTKAALPRSALTPPDLVAAALARLRCAPRVIGPIDLRNLRGLDPVWRPLLEGLSGVVAVRWIGAHTPDTFGVSTQEIAPGPDPEVVICSDPRTEIVDALRWARELIASSAATVGEIAIAATDPTAWDEAMLALVRESDLPVRFSHGVPALTTSAGQTCAALADALTQGLSQDRVRRLLTRFQTDGIMPADCPFDPLRGVPHSAALTTPTHWEAALEAAHPERDDGFDPRLLLPLLKMIAIGPSAAAQARDFLQREARELWDRALLRSPPEAIVYRLAELRVLDRGDAATCASWGPAAHLAASPRRFVRLVGLTAGSWPRQASADPLLPEHLYGGRRLETPTVMERDRADFVAIRYGASGAFVLSRALRSAQGRILAKSPLEPKNARKRVVRRAVPPTHAFSEADRLLARPIEAADHLDVARATACLTARRSPEVTAWDGLLRAEHPVVVRAFMQPQSATSLQRMLRDPAAFVWRYALEWRSSVVEPFTVQLDARSYGELVHELLQRSVDALEPTPSLAAASPEEKQEALDGALAHVRDRWPVVRATPPAALWQHTLASAAAMAFAALTFDPPFKPGTRSWTELGFGQAEHRQSRHADGPWDEAGVVTVPGTGVRVRGRIDRLDLLAADQGVRLTDYKTGAVPRQQRVRLDGGRELQRIIYACAALVNLPECRHVLSRLMHLGAEPPLMMRLDEIGAAIERLAELLLAAETVYRKGLALPGIDEAGDRDNPFRLALPAEAETYFLVKAGPLRRAFGPFCRVWSEP